MTRFTDEQMARLAKYEGDRRPFSTVLDSGYARNLDSEDYDFLSECYQHATGQGLILNRSCNRCCFDLIEAVGRLYRKQLAETPKKTPKKEDKKPTTKKGKK